MLDADLLKNLIIATLTTLLCPFLLNILIGLINKRNKINESICRAMLFDIYIPLTHLTNANLKLFDIIQKNHYTDQTEFIFRELTTFYENIRKNIKTEILVDPITMNHLSFSNYSSKNLIFRLIRYWHYKCLRKDVNKRVNDLKRKLGYPTIVGRSKLAKLSFVSWYTVNLLIAVIPSENLNVYLMSLLIIFWFISIFLCIKYLKYLFYEI